MSRSPLERPVQIAYAVADLDHAAQRFAATTGAGPFFVVEHVALSAARVRGIDATFDHSSAYGQWGDVMVELVCEHTAPLVEPGRVHHTAFLVPSLPGAQRWCTEQGWAEVLYAQTRSGQQFAFHDATGDLGHLVELYEPSVRLREFYSMVAAAADGWDGADPVRTPG